MGRRQEKKAGVSKYRFNFGLLAFCATPGLDTGRT
jgi:hypothetical protein